MTTHDRDKVISAAKTVGAYRYINRAAKDEPTHTFTVEQLEAFYAIAYEAGRVAEREAFSDAIADSQKQVAMLRDTLFSIRDGSMGLWGDDLINCNKALATTEPKP